MQSSVWRYLLHIVYMHMNNHVFKLVNLVYIAWCPYFMGLVQSLRVSFNTMQGVRAYILCIWYLIVGRVTYKLHENQAEKKI